MDRNANTNSFALPTVRPARPAGFSLVELLVVCGIIVLLCSLLLAAIGVARERKKVVLATTQVNEIYAALQLYYEELRGYPPDTGNYAADDTNTEPYAIQRYLATKIVDEMGNPHGPFLTIEPQFLKGAAKTVGGVNGMQLYSDPWGNPYQYDAMHVIVDPKTGAVTRIGEPWPAGTADTDKTVNVKVWSNGPDGKCLLGSLTPNGQKGTGVDADNINSWTK